MRVTYKDLQNKSYKQLIKEGAKEEQIQKKLSDLYLKNDRQLIINEKEGYTLSKALKELKKGRVTQGVLIEKTARSNVKKDVTALKKASKLMGKNSYANKVYTQYQRGEINIYQLNNFLYKYTDNPAKYEESINGNSDVEIIMDLEVDNWLKPYLDQAKITREKKQNQKVAKIKTLNEQAWRSTRAVR